MPENIELKEKRIRKLAPIYYSRKDILNYLFKFSNQREVSPRYFEGFGKRPDSFQYPSDILSLVKKGATSFHCSEELWQDPLLISTELSQEELKNLRIGWDLIIDIDCNWIDYSKKAAQAIIKSLDVHGVKNIGVKFSGSKGFHIIVPWESFPEEIDGIKTSEMFPEWPRAIIGYLKELSRPRLSELVKDISDFSNVSGFTGIKCKSCNNLANENYLINLECLSCKKHQETFKSDSKDYKKKKCPYCRSPLTEISQVPFYHCTSCEVDSISNTENFDESTIEVDFFKVLGLDLLLVSPRHLFRMPYSLHEKTSLASVVIDKNNLTKFELKDADPFNVKILEFSPKPQKDEAKELLIHAIDWQKSAIKDKPSIKYGEYKKSKNDFKPLNISKFEPSLYPPVINNILKGMADGKKRGLFILLNFFRSIGMKVEDIEKEINKWNEKNTPMLKKGYIDSQLIWHSRNKVILPPNFDNDIYKEIGVLELDALSKKTKNPINYVFIKSKK